MRVLNGDRSELAARSQHATSNAPSFEVDIVVIGAGGAGLAAAALASARGARVLIIEHTEYVGGTTAWSAGTSWIPGNHHGLAINPDDSIQAAATYLDQVVGERAPHPMRSAFLQHGADAVRAYERDTALRFRAYAKHPDYESDLEGAVLAGRALEPLPFDGRLLGPNFRLLRPPIPEFTVLGGMMVDRTDIQHLLNMSRSVRSLRHGLGLLGRYALDRLRYPRGTRLVMGNAHVARLLYSLMPHEHVTLACNTRVTALTPDATPNDPTLVSQQSPSASYTLTLVSEGSAPLQVRARQAVILASGGFNRHPERRAERLPSVPPAWCPGAPGHTGELRDLLTPLGVTDGQGALSHAFWAPVSLRRRSDGTSAVFPHFVMDRAKPGTLVVNGAGERFVNESTSYHRFALAQQQTPNAIPAYLIADANALQRYGLGMVRPGGRGLEPFLSDGYLVRAKTLAELAQRLALPPERLQATVTRWNEHAQHGHDPDFQRGVTAYQQNLGDPNWPARHPGANPCIGPLLQAPFYAVRLFPGDIGAATGLVTNTDAQVLRADGRAIPGLYAIGNDQHSIMGGTYPAPGITIGPGLVMAYLATRHALQPTETRINPEFVR